MKTCPECQREFPNDLIKLFITETGKRPMCPICALRERNKHAGLPLDTPFMGRLAQEMHRQAVAHLAAMAKPWKMEEP